MTVNTEELDVIIVDDVKYLDYGDASKYVGLTVGTLQQYVLKGLFHSTRLPGFKKTRKYLRLDQLEAYNGGEVNGYRGQSKVLPVTGGSPVPHHAAPFNLPGMPTGHISYQAYVEAMETLRSLGINARDIHRDFMQQHGGGLIEYAEDIERTAKSNGTSYVDELASRENAGPKVKQGMQSMWDGMVERLPVESEAETR